MKLQLDATEFFNLDQKSIEIIKEIDKEMGHEAWSDSSWEGLKVSNDYKLYLYKGEKDKILGFILFVLVPDENDELWHLLKIVIDKEHRKQGIGEIGLKQFLNKRVFLEVDAQNVAAVRLYQKLGFEILHLAKNYYGNGRDALKMLFLPKKEQITL